MTIICRGILVDMDGTMVDSNAIVELTWGGFCDQYGFDLPQLLRFSHGRLAIDTVREYLPDLRLADAEALVRGLQAKEVTLNDKVLPVAGAPEFLARLDELGVPWALVTSANFDIADVRFRITGLPWPKVAIVSEDVQSGKPAPEGYLAAAAQLGLSGEDCVVFEDAAPGVRAGLSAGARVVVVGDDSAEITQGLPRITDLRGVTIDPTSQPGVFALQV